MARLIVARNWKVKDDFQSDEWYREVWIAAINNKLTCSIALKGLINKNNFIHIWGECISFLLLKGKGLCTLTRVSPVLEGERGSINGEKMVIS